MQSHCYFYTFTHILHKNLDYTSWLKNANANPKIGVYNIEVMSMYFPKIWHFDERERMLQDEIKVNS